MVNVDAEKIFSALAKLDFYADARMISGTASSFSIEDGKISCVEGGITGIGARALVNGSFGYAWSTRLRDFPELLKKAEQLARLNQGSELLSAQEPAGASRGRNHVFPHAEEKVLLLREAEKCALSQKSKNATLTLRDSNIEKVFLSSSGSQITQKSSHVYFSAVSIAKEGVQIQKGTGRLASRRGYEKFDIASAAQTARESAERLLNSEPPPRGCFSVIMDPEMSGVFAHEAVGHASEGDSIIERESVLRGKLGEKIGSECVTMVDDPSFDDFGHYFYDDEGVEAQAVKIIEKGVLKNYLHSRASAHAFAAQGKTGNARVRNPGPKTRNPEPETSNGHCRAQGYESAPIVRMSNTLFAKGNESESEIFGVKEGIYTIGMKGGSVDIFSGDFMFAAKEAWFVRNGSKEKLLRDVTISGNILETLAKVEAVGKDFGTSPGFCGKMGQSVPVSDGGPHTRVGRMKVG